MKTYQWPHLKKQEKWFSLPQQLSTLKDFKGWDLKIMYSTHARILSGLILYRSYAGNHSYLRVSEFIPWSWISQHPPHLALAASCVTLPGPWWGPIEDWALSLLFSAHWLIMWLSMTKKKKNNNQKTLWLSLSAAWACQLLELGNCRSEAVGLCIQ